MYLFEILEQVDLVVTALHGLQAKLLHYRILLEKEAHKTKRAKDASRSSSDMSAPLAAIHRPRRPSPVLER